MERDHHEIFYEFPCWTGTCDGKSHIDFLGVRSDPRYWRGIKALPEGELETSYPRVGEQYFEWVSLLGAVKRAGNEFVMMELGAGWAPWLARGAVAARDFRKIPFRLVAVEGDAEHYGFALEHLARNGIDAGEHVVIDGVVTKYDGTAFFTWVEKSSTEYGCRVIGGEKALERVMGWLGVDVEPELGAKSIAENGTAYVKVKSVSLASLLAPFDHVDYIHMDIQGEEYNVLEACIDEVKKKVASLNIGTHSDEIQVKLRDLMAGRGFVSEFDFGRRSEAKTAWGTIQFRDGCQVWLNPDV